MAFWGVEVKGGSAYTHRLDNVRGRLHISQATLGIGSSTMKSIVQCNVGDKKPILLCSLLPDKAESCPLDLEFEEDDSVMFSVIGPLSVHLTGYYLGNSRHNRDGDDTDSYGEDIGESENEQSADRDTEDEYEDDFIDDGDIEMFPPSPGQKSGVVIEEILDDEKPANANGGRKRLIKKYKISDSDEDEQPQIVAKGGTSVPVIDSEDEEGLPISSLSKNKSTVKNTEVEEKSDEKIAKESKKKAEDASEHLTGLKRKSDTVIQDSEAQRGIELTNDTSVPSMEAGHEIGARPKKKKKERAEERTTGVDKNDVHNEDTTQSKDAKTEDIEQDKIVADEPEEKLLPNDKVVEQPNDSSMPSTEAGHEDGGKPKKKKKERAGWKTTGIGDDDKSAVHNEDITQSEVEKTDKIGQDQTVGGEPEEKLPSDRGIERTNDSSVPSTEDKHEIGGKPKKKKKERTEERTTGIEDDKRNVQNDDTIQSKDAKTDKLEHNKIVEDEPEEKLPNDKVVERPNDSSMPSTEAGDENGGKPKKKKRERTGGKTAGIGDDDKSAVHNEDITQSEVGNTDKIGQDQAVGGEPEEKLPSDRGVEPPNDSSVPSSVTGHENGGKPKKKKKERTEGKTPRVGDDDESDVRNEDTTQSEGAKTDKMDEDQTIRNEPEEKLPNDKSLDIDVEPTGDEDHTEEKKKKKKKKKKSKDQGSDKNADTEEEGKKGSVVDIQEKKAEAKQPSQVRTFTNGLVIEDLEMGKSEGKKASAGDKVSVRYVGRLKKSGQIFDSKVGRTPPLKFRLGAGKVVKGLDVGVNGMQVGDKRRITVPPTMGYGAKGEGKVTPNAWLVFEVELVEIN